jgi:hypothetical protein
MKTIRSISSNNLRRSAMLACLGMTLAMSTGCGNGVAQPDFDPLQAVTGKVMQGGKPVSGGVIKFSPVPAREEFIINSVVDESGTFKLTTVRTTDTTGERREGAPVGEYQVIYTPLVADQTVANVEPVTLPNKVRINETANDLTLEVPPFKR